MVASGFSHVMMTCVCRGGEGAPELNCCLRAPVPQRGLTARHLWIAKLHEEAKRHRVEEAYVGLVSLMRLAHEVAVDIPPVYIARHQRECAAIESKVDLVAPGCRHEVRRCL